MMDQPSILYCGDTTLTTAGSYLAGVMTHAGWDFSYTPSAQMMDLTIARTPRQLFIFSDYMARMIDQDAQDAILEQVQAGAGLLMIGGWESFCGMGGDWGGTAIGNALPVTIAQSDDRVNFDQAAVVTPATGEAATHPILVDLPWEQPPCIGGYNRVTPRDNAHLLLEVAAHRITRADRDFAFQVMQRDPLLVVGQFGQGRTAALMTDAAPHWVGPLVDWGTPRVTAQASGSIEVEVGCHYTRLLTQLLQWTGQLPTPLAQDP